MLLFDMRNISSNSMIPVSVVETMTDIVLDKMRASSPGSPMIRVMIAPILESGDLIEGVIGDGVLSSNPNDHAVVVLDRDVPGLQWHEVELEEADDTREEVMRKIEQAIETIVKAVMATRPEESDDDPSDPDNVREAVSSAIAENIAIFALDNSVPGPGQVLRIRPMADRNSLEAEIGGAEIEVPVPIPVAAAGPDSVVAVDVAEAVASAVGEEERRTRLTESVKEALAEILGSSDDEIAAGEEEPFQLDLPKFGISVTATGEEDDSALEGSGDQGPFGVRFGDDLFSVPEFGFTVDTTTTTTTEEVPERKGNPMTMKGNCCSDS